ncbi:MAG TPA: hypothetical protein VL200_15265 [Lacunisphaera sp.]|jgi:hypothetical protein|nr:hypothetical protein [Lacunisphaera sp.]
MKMLYFDLDGVICTATDGSYEKAEPIHDAIATVNALFESGYRIVIFTSRFMGRTRGNAAEAQKLGFEFTTRQLAGWNVKFHELRLGKPVYDVLIDDRAVFFHPDWTAIRTDIERRCRASSAGKA